MPSDHKFVYNTHKFFKLEEINLNTLSLLENFHIREEITVIKGKIIFPENHYFHLIANLRKARFKISLDFTLEYFIENINAFINNRKISVNLLYSCILNEQGLQHLVYENHREPETSTFNEVEIYREDFMANNHSSQINFSNGFLHALNTYRVENELDDIFLLNQNNHLTGSFYGNVFLIKGQELLTPRLDDGARDTAARQKFLLLAKKWPEFDAVSEKTLPPFEITKADECFIFTPFYKLISLSKFRKTDFDNHYIQAIKKKLLELVQ
ncbi:4-amino-4-deoxychorismate lyase [Candidatus Ornithobacterium hominis]|uniref:4-amino-4-deoxychorismate lyase n=1 Tax=Candidatus Ornithobacterium hominis TaxID=2497989 RepID=A0A383TVB4_9FLAO|nr:aminotransferase class IV [Candidatus Ornithobacterium hominis]MCT7904821.1 aminotransferase class IV [Candidatus Ornithobacterium hominis]SZD71592.1 4-amino-4-deoxychorismate lyase [Candidatus Ornithobacterium hominis]